MTTTELTALLGQATKGPWVAENARKITLDPNPAWLAPINTVEDDDGGFYTIALSPSWHRTDDEPEAQANASLIAMAPDLAARVLELEAENKRLRGYIEGMIPEMEKFNQRGCGRNCYMEGDWFDVSEARAALTSKGEG